MAHDAYGRDLIASLGNDVNGASLQALTNRLEQGRAAHVARLGVVLDDGQSNEIKAVIAAYDAALLALPQVWAKAREQHSDVGLQPGGSEH